MKRSLSLIVALLCLASAQCGWTIPETRPGIDDPETFGVTGTWKWVRSIGGFGGNDLRTPETVGYSRTIRFRDDGMFETFRNGTLQEVDHYTITRRSAIWHSRWRIDFRSFRIAQAIFEVTADTLRLADDITDGYGHDYSRVREEP
ncbi:MAG: hypothetical protein ACE15D_07080 [Candidatus Eisenbacteria bacterium]